METRFVPIVTDEDITKALEANHGIKCVYAIPDDEVINTTDFFHWKPVRMSFVENSKYPLQEIALYYVSVNRDDLEEFKVVETLQGLGLYVEQITYDMIPLTDRKNHADVVMYKIKRKFKDPLANRVKRGD